MTAPRVELKAAIQERFCRVLPSLAKASGVTFSLQAEAVILEALKAVLQAVDFGNHRAPVSAGVSPVLPQEDFREYEAHCRGIAEGVRLAIQTVELCRRYTSEMFPDNSGILNYVDVRRIIRALQELNVNEAPQGEAQEL